MSHVPYSRAYSASRIHQFIEARHDAGGRARLPDNLFELFDYYLIETAREFQPLTVRNLYYRMLSYGFFPKDERNYNRVQNRSKELRDHGRIPYGWFVDGTRLARQVDAHGSVDAFLNDAAQLYRRDLWRRLDVRVEVWCEKDAMSGVIWPVAREWGVPLMVMRGQTSATFAYEAAMEYREIGKPVIVYYLGDFDPAGLECETSLTDKLTTYVAGEVPVDVERVFVTPEDIDHLGLATHAVKRSQQTKRSWLPHLGREACELDAVPPDHLRDVLDLRLSQHVPQQLREQHEQVEAEERELLRRIAHGAA